jgi:hypothetical protein
MSKKTDVETLTQLPYEEIDQRIQCAAGRVETRMQRAMNEERDLTQRESDLCFDDRAELSALRDALDSKRRDAEHAERNGLEQRQREQSDRMTQAISEAIEQQSRDNRLSPLAISERNLTDLEVARRQYCTLSVIEQRSALDTSAMGTAVEYAAGGLLAPQTLWRASGIPTTEPPAGVKATVPLVTLPSASALVAEGSPHAEFDDVSPDPVTLKRTGAWSDLSSEALVSSALSEISGAHSRIIARDVDLAAITKLESTPGDLDVDTALTTVAAEAATDVSRLWIVGTPSAIAFLAGNAVFQATNASDIGSYATNYGGARLYVSPAASADQLTVFYPGGFRVFATPLASAVVVDPTDGGQRFGQWLLFGIGQSLAGAAVTVGLASA